MGLHLIILPVGVVNTRNVLHLANRVLTCAGLGRVATVENEANLQAMEVLAKMSEVQQELFDIAGYQRNGQAEMLVEVVVGQRAYPVPDGFLNMRAKPMIGDVKLIFTVLDRLRREASNVEGEGRPAYYSEDAGNFMLYPVPDAAFMTGRLVTNGGLYYICIKEHTAGEDADEPGVGANQATYWIATTSSTTTEAWASGVPYKIGRLSIPYYSTPTQLYTNGQFPILPPEYYPALIQGACWQMKEWLGRDHNEIMRAGSRYLTLFNDRLAKSRIAHDLPQQEAQPL